MAPNSELHRAALESTRKKKGGSGININPHHETLHHALGIPEDRPIPYSEKVAAAHSSNPALRKKGQFAVNATKFSH